MKYRKVGRRDEKVKKQIYISNEINYAIHFFSLVYDREGKTKFKVFVMTKLLFYHLRIKSKLK